MEKYDQKQTIHSMENLDACASSFASVCRILWKRKDAGAGND